MGCAGFEIALKMVRTAVSQSGFEEKTYFFLIELSIANVNQTIFSNDVSRII